MAISVLRDGDRKLGFHQVAIGQPACELLFQFLCREAGGLKVTQEGIGKRPIRGHCHFLGQVRVIVYRNTQNIFWPEGIGRGRELLALDAHLGEF
jgi:hypothetical protein